MTDPKLKKLADELAELEKRAGIAEKVEDANLGPMFPNLDATPDEYFKDVADHARRRIRNLYFKLEDSGLRKEMIRKQLAIDAAAGEYWKNKVIAERENLAAAQRRASSLSWTWAGCFAALCVAVGAYFFKLYGAIAGALMGFFFAQGMLESQRNAHAEAVRAAQESLDELLESVAEGDANPALFNASEGRTGERDDDFDLVSVYNPHPVSRDD
jgi:hypothetical protein